MPEDNQQLEGNEELTSTPDEKRESEETSEDLASLFEENSEDEPVTREEFNRLEKGIKNLASMIGRQKKEEKPEEKTPTSHPILKKLYFKSNPEAELIWEEVEKEASMLGKDPFELYENSSYFKGEAKAKAEAKRVEEENKLKINKPANGIDSPSTDISSVKPEEVEKLTPAQKLEWIKLQAQKERQAD